MNVNGGLCISTTTRMSLLCFRSRKLLGDEKEEESAKNDEDVVEEGQIVVFESRMLDYVNEQHYYGLDQKGDVETPAKLKKGLSGIASCYENELFYPVFIKYIISVSFYLSLFSTVYSLSQDVEAMSHHLLLRS